MIIHADSIGAIIFTMTIAVGKTGANECAVV